MSLGTAATINKFAESTWILNYWIGTTFESAIVISIIYFHHKCSKIHEDAPKHESTIVLASYVSDL
jgi:hypothetical protein